MTSKKATKRITPDGATEAQAERRYSCGLCTFKTTSPRVLARHMERVHIGLRSQVPAPLMDLIERQQSASAALREAANWLESRTGADGVLRPEAIEQIRREDARIQLVLRLLASSKITRAFKVDRMFQDLLTFLQEKLRNEAWRQESSPQEVLAFMERIQTLQHKEMSFLTEVAELGEVNLGALLERLVRAVSGTGQAMGGPGARSGSLSAAGAAIPGRPDQRERLRRTARALILQVSEESE